MELIQWNSALSVKIAEIDEQHQYLIKLINKLFEAVLEGEANKIIEETINKLEDYASVHFSTEEIYFEKYNYPGAELHKSEHKEMQEKIAGYKSELMKSNGSLPMEVFNFLKDWLQEHIMDNDQKYSKYLIKNGVK